MKFNSKIFRDYDIRGVYPTDLDPPLADLLGKSLGTYLIERGLKRVVVGRDNRLSSPVLCENFIKGILSTGCDVTHIGVTVTPAIHFLTCGKEFDCGVSVTASHNPKEYNGFRIDLASAVSLYGVELRKLMPILKSEKFVSGNGKYFEQALSQNYIDYMLKHFKFNKGLKVVVNPGGGAACGISKKVFTRAGLNTTFINGEFTDAFPKFVPDPENASFTKELSAAVCKSTADVGICFDTDGDRVGFVDNKGVVHSADNMLMLFAKKILAEEAGSLISYDIKCTDELAKVIANLGGTSQIVRTGHPYLFQEIREHGAILAGEYSGHIFFGDRYFGFDDGIYAACRLLEILDKSGESFSSLMSEFSIRFSLGELKIPCGDDVKFEVVSRLKRIISAENFTNISIIDGIRASYSKTGWFLVRASNTNPYLSIRIEGKDAAEAGKIEKFIRSTIQSVM